jgi:hypothetical protein
MGADVENLKPNGMKAKIFLPWARRETHSLM